MQISKISTSYCTSFKGKPENKNNAETPQETQSAGFFSKTIHKVASIFPKAEPKETITEDGRKIVTEKDGSWKMWDKNGTLRREMHQPGISKEWDENGNLTKTTLMSKTEILKEWNGKGILIYEFDGKMHRRWDDEGNLTQEWKETPQYFDYYDYDYREPGDKPSKKK